MKNVLIVLAFLTTSLSFSDSEGPNQPSAGINNGGTGADWVFPTFAFEDDGLYATASGTFDGTSKFMRLSDFGFSIPTGSTITGIEVMIDRSASAASTVTDQIVQLYNNSSMFNGGNLGKLTTWPTTDAFETYGASNNLWGMTWTVDDVNDSSFAVYISAVIPGSVEARVDAVWITVYYTNNGAPEATNLQVMPSMPGRNDDIRVTLTYTDPEDDPESGSEIRWYKDGVLQPLLNDIVTVPSIQTDFGEVWNFTVRVSDGFSFDTLKTSPGVAITNAAPSANSAAISPDPPYRDADLTLSYVFEDSDGDPESGSKIVWYKNSVQQVALDDSQTVPETLTTLGDVWFATVQPSDGLALGNVISSQSVTVINTTPTATGVALFPFAPTEDQSLTLAYTYNDVDGDAESGTEILWYKNAAHQAALDGSLSVSDTLTTLGDVWHATVQPSDGTLMGTLVSTQMVTVINIPPTASNLFVNHSALDNLIPLVAEYDYSDFEGETESGTILRWYKNHAQQLDLLNSTSVPIGKLTLGDSWYFSVEPSDGLNFGTIQTSNVISISASMPAESPWVRWALVFLVLITALRAIRTRSTSIIG